MDEFAKQIQALGPLGLKDKALTSEVVKDE
jgi:hypothetical protein